MIPVIDLTAAHAQDEQQLLAALHSHGFVCVRGHAVRPALVAAVFAMSRDLFAATHEHKQRWAYNATTNCGHVALKRERLDITKPESDPKEAFNIPKFIPSAASFTHNMPPELHAPILETFSRAVHAFLLDLLARISTALGLSQDYLPSRHPYDRQSGDILRLLCYHSATETGRPGDVRAGAHTDYGSLTALFQSGVGGLQVLIDSPSGDQEWVDVPPVQDAIVINAGDLLEFWTGGYIRSTVHRVEHPHDLNLNHEPRFSVAYFLHPDDDAPLSVLPSPVLQSAEKPKERKGSGRVFAGPTLNEGGAPVITAREHLIERLKASYG